MIIAKSTFTWRGRRKRKCLLPKFAHCWSHDDRRSLSCCSFVKKVACCPYVVNKADFDTFSDVFTKEEKCHILLLVMEARKQACLLYGLRRVLQCFNRS